MWHSLENSIEASLLLRPPYCWGLLIVEASLLLRPPYCWGRLIVEAALLLRPPYCWGRLIVEAALLLRPPYCWGRLIVETALLLRPPYCWGCLYNNCKINRNKTFYVHILIIICTTLFSFKFPLADIFLHMIVDLFNDSRKSEILCMVHPSSNLTTIGLLLW